MISNQPFQRGKGYLRSVSMTTVGLKQLFFNHLCIMTLYCFCTQSPFIAGKDIKVDTNNIWPPSQGGWYVHSCFFHLKIPYLCVVSYQRIGLYQAEKMINSVLQLLQEGCWTDFTWVLPPPHPRSCHLQIVSNHQRLQRQGLGIPTNISATLPPTVFFLSSSPVVFSSPSLSLSL